VQTIVSVSATAFLYTTGAVCQCKGAHVGTGRNAVPEFFSNKISMVGVLSISAVINVRRRVIAL
jgi:hypothetical protein